VFAQELATTQNAYIGSEEIISSMAQLPSQVQWRDFVRVLHKLGYTAEKSKAGSVRAFSNPSRNPILVSFREPHPQSSMTLRMLREYLRKLHLEPQDFMELLEDR
jgi:predicted RNA binding protein YcfA (HicA-like mRNA interferase family)